MMKYSILILALATTFMGVSATGHMHHRRHPNYPEQPSVYHEDKPPVYNNSSCVCRTYVITKVEPVTVYPTARPTLYVIPQYEDSDTSSDHEKEKMPVVSYSGTGSGEHGYGSPEPDNGQGPNGGYTSSLPGQSPNGGYGANVPANGHGPTGGYTANISGQSPNDQGPNGYGANIPANGHSPIGGYTANIPGQNSNGQGPNGGHSASLPGQTPNGGYGTPNTNNDQGPNGHGAYGVPEGSSGTYTLYSPTTLTRTTTTTVILPIQTGTLESCDITSPHVQPNPKPSDTPYTPPTPKAPQEHNPYAPYLQKPKPEVNITVVQPKPVEVPQPVHNTPYVQPQPKPADTPAYVQSKPAGNIPYVQPQPKPADTPTYVQSKPAGNTPYVQPPPQPKPYVMTETHETYSTPATMTPAMPPTGMYWSIVYSPYADNRQCKDSDTIKKDLQDISRRGFKNIRVYDTDCGLLPVLTEVCGEYQLGVILGVMITTGGLSTGDKCVEDIIAWGQWKLVVAIIIGNESVFNHICSFSELAVYITKVRAQFKNANYTGPISTSETVGALENGGSAICESIDFISINFQPYFDGGVAAEDAGGFLSRMTTQAANVCGGKKEVYVLEAGWPSGGSNNGKAIASPQAQKVAIGQFEKYCPGRIDYFTYTNDMWKTPGPNGVEQFFGCSNSFEIKAKY